MKTSKITVTAIILTSLILSSSLASCANKNSVASSNNGGSSEIVQGSSTVTPDVSVYLQQIEYYEGLIRELETSIVYIKEENFIKASEYEQKITELENKIQLFSDSSGKNDAPSSDEKEEHRTDLGIGNTQVTPSDQFTYDIKNRTVTITGYNGSSSEVNIPAKIHGLSVVAIGEGAFKGTTVQKIVLPEGITHVDWFAFSDCKSLCEITIPSSVSEIGHGAFDGCSSSLLIICKSDSYAEKYAQSWGIRHEDN